MSIPPALRSLANNEHVRRVFHAFWQAAIGVLLVQLFAVHSSADVKSALFLAGSTGAAAVKALILSQGL